MIFGYIENFHTLKKIICTNCINLNVGVKNQYFFLMILAGKSNSRVASRGHGDNQGGEGYVTITTQTRR